LTYKQTLNQNLNFVSSMHPRYLLTVLGACLLTLSGNSADYPWYTQGDFAPAQRLEFEVTNPTNLERPNTPVIIKRENFPLADLHEMMITVVDPTGDPRPAPSDSVLNVQGGHQLREEHNGRMVFHQLDDLDKDGIWDELFFQLDMKPNETRTIYIYLGENIRGWNRHHTHANIGSYCRHIMPFWETEEVGWKIWFANSVDAYGKRKPTLVSPILYTQNIDGYGIANLNHDYGSDIQEVAPSFGASAICLFEFPDDPDSVSMPRKTPAKQRLHPESLWNAGQISDTRYAYDVIVNGPLRSTIRIKGMNWDTGNGYYEYEQYYTAYAHQNYCISKVHYTTFQPNGSGVLMGCGMKKKPQEDNFIQKNGYLISSGPEEVRDPEKIDQRDNIVVDFIGGAIIVKEEYKPEYQYIPAYTGNHVFRVTPDKDNTYEYMVCTAWSEGTKLTNKEEFNQYVDRMAIEFNNPITYKFIQLQSK
jgi:hypothetical protein